MKLGKTIVISLLTITASQAAVTISGTGVSSGIQDHNGIALAAGSLGLWIADTGNDGFGSLINNAIQDTTTFNVGDMFGGDIIIARASTTVFGGNGRAAASFSYDNPSAIGGAVDMPTGTQFAFVWFSTAAGSVTAATTQAASDMFYGVARFDDTKANGGWVTGTETSGTLGFSTGALTATNPFKGLVVANFTSNNTAALNNAQTEFSIVPEPSAAFLGAIGALGLLRRRRI